MKDFNFGDTVRETITGYEGVVVGKHAFISGTVQYQVQPRTLDDKGKPQDQHIADWQTLDLVTAGEPREPSVFELPTFDFGDQVEDTLTDFKGTVTSKSEFINGCVQYGVQSRALDKDHDLIRPRLFDSQRLALKSKGGIPAASPGGGPELMAH